jgi:hypothetical protein
MADEHVHLIKNLVIPLRDRGVIEFIARWCNELGELLLDYTALAVALGYTNEKSARRALARVERETGGAIQRHEQKTDKGQTQNLVFFDLEKIAELYKPNPLMRVLSEKKALKAQQYRTTPPPPHVFTPPSTACVEGVSGVPNKEHARACASEEFMFMNEMNMNMNSDPAARFGHLVPGHPKNVKLAESFALPAKARKREAKNYPLLALEKVTEQWREFLYEIENPIENPIGHWVDFVRRAENIRQDKEKARANAYVGAGSTYNHLSPVRARLGEPGALNGTAAELAGNPPAAGPLFLVQPEAKTAAATVLTDAEACTLVRDFAASGLLEQVRALFSGNYPGLIAPEAGEWRALAETALQQGTN